VPSEPLKKGKGEKRKEKKGEGGEKGEALN